MLTKSKQMNADCAVVIETFGRKDLLQFMQERRYDSTIVIENLLKMVRITYFVLNLH